MPSNRVLNLSELAQPFFRDTVRSLQTLLDEYAGFYLHPSKQWEYPWALESASLEPGSDVLDAGCGASIFPLYLARQGYRVVACDIDPDWDLVEGTGIPYVRADLTNLPFGTGQFDAVFCISVIEHLVRERMICALDELARVLRPGGRLILTTDFYEDHRAALTYSGSGHKFPVDWNVFDASMLELIVLRHPGFIVTDLPNLDVDWPNTKEQMLRFHGYPYTSVGIAMIRL